MNNRPIGNTAACCSVVVFIAGTVLFAAVAWVVFTQAGVQVVP